MLTKMARILLATILVLVSNGFTQARRLMAAAPGGGTTRPAGIGDLREEIKNLEALCADPAGSPQAQDVHRITLQAQRVQLYALLKKRVGALRAYQSSVATAAERQAVENDIRNKLDELRGLEASMRTGPASLAGRAVPPRAVKSPVVTPFPQSTVDQQYDIKLTEAVNLISAKTATQDRETQANFLGARAELFAMALARKLQGKRFMANMDEARVDKQVGGGSANAGSTSLVTKGATPAILGFAVENGALTKDTSGTTITYRGNLVGTIEALQKKGFVLSFKDDSPGTSALRKLSYSFSFDTSRGNNAGTFVGNRQQLSAYSLRYEIKNDRDPRNPKYDKRWEQFSGQSLQDLVDALANIINGVFTTDQVLIDWNTKAKRAIAAKSSAADVRAELIRQLEEELPGEDQLSADAQDAIKNFDKTYNSFLRERDKLLAFIANGPLFTAEYTNNRRPGLVDTSNVLVVAEGDMLGLFGFGSGKTDLTYNGALTFFNSRPGPGMRRLRDFDHSLQLDIPLGDVAKTGSFILSFSGQYKRMMENEMMTGALMNGAMLNTKGDIGVGQLKFTIPVKGSGFKIPLSVTFANRTELIKEKEVRGNIGFTFDLDTIFSKFKP